MAKGTSKHTINFSITGLTDLDVYQKKLAHASKRVKELTAAQAKRGVRGTKDTAAYRKAAVTLANYTKKEQAHKLAIESTTASLKKNALALEKKAMATKRAAAQTKKSGKGMMALGAATIGASMAIRKFSGFMIDSVKVFAKFERGIKNVTTLLSAEDSHFFSGDLFRGALDVTKRYGFAVSDVTKALFNAVSAGVKGADAITFLDEASKLAIAGVTDLKSATMGLTTVMNAYGMEASEASKVSEILFTTQKFGVTTVAELSKSLGVVVPFAAASGIKFEELGAAIAVTTRSGLDAAKSVTALRAAISQMQKPAAQSRDLFVKWGIPIGAAQMKAVGFTETMRRLNLAYKGNPRDIELMFGNVRGLTAIFSIAGDNAQDYNKFLAELNDETLRGANVSRATEVQLESTQVKLDQLTASWNLYKISVGDTEWSRNLIANFTEAINLATEFGVVATASASWFDSLRYFTNSELTSIGMGSLIPYLDMVRGSQTETDKLIEKLAKVKIEEAFTPLKSYDLEQLNKYSDKISEIPSGYKMMLDQIVQYTDYIDTDDVGVMSLLNIDQLKMMDIATRYKASLGFIKAADDEVKILTKAEEDAALKVKSDASMAYNDFELKNRMAQNKKLNDIASKAITSGEYSNITSLKQTEERLASAYKLKVYYQVLGGASATEEARVEQTIGQLSVKLKKQNQEIKSSNSKKYNDEELKSKTSLEDEIRRITKEGIDNDYSVDEIKGKKLQAKKDYYLEIQKIGGEAAATTIATTKALNDLELQMYALESKVGKKKSKTFNTAKLAAEIILSEKKAELVMQEAEGSKTSLQVKRELLKLDLDHYQMLDERGDANPEEKARNSKSLSNTRIDIAKLEHQEFLDREKVKQELQIEGAQLVADALNAAANSSFNNWNKRNEEQKDALKDRLDDGSISQEQYDKKLEALEKKAFKKRQENEKKLATISFMQELANIAVQAAASPANAFTFGAAGVSQYAIMSALALGRFGVTMGTISSQKFAKGGMVYGNSHAQGGEKFSLGGRVMELEGGEAVINKRSASAFKDQLSAINVAGGGVPFAGSGSSRGGASSSIDYELLAKVIGRNTNVVLPVESLNQVQNRIKVIENGSRF